MIPRLLIALPIEIRAFRFGLPLFEDVPDAFSLKFEPSTDVLAVLLGKIIE